MNQELTSVVERLTGGGNARRAKHGGSKQRNQVNRVEAAKCEVASRLTAATLFVALPVDQHSLICLSPLLSHLIHHVPLLNFSLSPRFVRISHPLSNGNASRWSEAQGPCMVWLLHIRLLHRKMTQLSASDGNTACIFYPPLDKTIKNTIYVIKRAIIMSIEEMELKTDYLIQYR